VHNYQHLLRKITKKEGFMKLRYKCLSLILVIFSSRTEAGLLDRVKQTGKGIASGVAEAVNAVPPALPSITNIQYIGLNDKEWAKQNGYPEEKLSDFKAAREKWLDDLVENSMMKDIGERYLVFQDCTLWTFKGNVVTVNSVGNLSPLYTIVFPENAVRKIKWASAVKSKEEHMIFLCDDGFFSVLLNDKLSMNYIYFTSLGDKPLDKNDSFGLLPNYWGLNLNDRKEVQSRPWFSGNIKKVNDEYKQTLEQTSKNQRLKEPLLEKMDLGPLVLGSTLEEVKAQGSVTKLYEGVIDEKYAFKLKEPIKYANETVQSVWLTFQEKILVEIRFQFPSTFDAELLRNAFNTKYGKYDYVDTYGNLVHYYWGKEIFKRHNEGKEWADGGYGHKLTLSFYNGHKKDPDVNPSLKLNTYKFGDKIRALRSEREGKVKDAKKAKEDAILNAL